MKATREELIERLRYARKRIERGDYQFICNAVECADEDYIIRRWINKQLQGYRSYRQWLQHYRPEFYHEHFHEDFRIGRLQWIDAMIRELEK